MDPAPVVPAPVFEFVAPAPAVSYAAPAPVFDYVAPASAVTFAAPAPVIEYVAPAPVFEYIPPAPAVSLSVSSQQLRTGVNLDVTGLVYPQFPGTAVESSASQVVGPLPPCEVFAAPVFDQVHQEQLAGGEIPENLVEIPVIPEQVIVQAISRVAHSLPPDEEFPQPVYSPVHQEQFPAGETTENFVKIPVVQEQVFVQDIPEVVVPLPPAQEFSAPVYGHVHQVFAGMRPERLVDARGPQRCVRTVPSVTSLPPLPDLCRGDVHNATLVKFLLRQTLLQRNKEEEERKKEEEEEEKEQFLEQSMQELRLLSKTPGRSLQQTNRMMELLKLRDAASSSTSKRKRKKRKKRRLPRSPRPLLLGRTRRRQRQWSAWNAGFTGYDAPRVMSPMMLRILVGMDQKDRCSGIYMAGIACGNAPCAVFSSLVRRPFPGPMVQTVQNPVEFTQVQLRDEVVFMPVVVQGLALGTDSAETCCSTGSQSL